jgi:lactoylglutathione lyase
VTVDHIGLSVADLEAMAHWYAAVLGAVEDYRVERPAIAMRAIVLIDADGFRLELLHRENSTAGHGPESVGESLLRHGFGHLALHVTDVHAMYSRLVALGAGPVMPPGPGSRPGMVIAFVADPEHNLLELVSR